ncbi:MAG: hypothetical protein ACI4C4_10610 [Lachnospiraceae bacterium]
MEQTGTEQQNVCVEQEVIEGKTEEGTALIQKIWEDNEEEFQGLYQRRGKKLWYGGTGAQELTETKEYVWEDKRLKEYERLFDTSETTKFSEIGSVYYSDREYRLYCDTA